MGKFDPVRALRALRGWASRPAREDRCPTCAGLLIFGLSHTCPTTRRVTPG